MSVPLPTILKNQARRWRLCVVFLAGFTSSAQTIPSQPAVVDLTAPALRAHANLPNYFRAGPPLAQDLAEARAGAALRGVPWKGLHFFVNDAENLGGFTPAAAREIYQKLACQADAVIVGHIQSSASHTSAWGTVYTDYAFATDALLKDNRKSPIRENTALVLTRPGGSAVVNGDPITFDFRGFPELKPGTTYLQFLHYLPESSAYQALDAYATLIASGKDWVVARRGSAVALPELTQGVLEAAIGNWLLSCVK